MRRIVAIAGLVVALATAIGVVALGAAAMREAPAPAGAAAAEIAAPDELDYCYVESLIYYGVETVDLSTTLLRAEGVDESVRAAASDIADETSASLEDLREWYLEWRDARPLAWPDDGPCAGHGDHSAMAGMPTWAQQQALAEADGAEAARLYATLLTTQNAGMAAFVAEIAATDPHPRVSESAVEVVAVADRIDRSLADVSAR